MSKPRLPVFQILDLADEHRRYTVDVLGIDRDGDVLDFLRLAFDASCFGHSGRHIGHIPLCVVRTDCRRARHVYGWDFGVGPIPLPPVQETGRTYAATYRYSINGKPVYRTLTDLSDGQVQLLRAMLPRHLLRIVPMRMHRPLPRLAALRN